MNLKILVLFLFLTMVLVHPISQMISNKDGVAFTQTPFFNPYFISNNKIKYIKGFYSVTSPTIAVMQTGLYCIYEFDEKGRLIHTLETYQGTEKKDSLENFYVYDDQNRLLQHRKKEFKGFTCIENQRDDKGRIIKQIFRRDILNDRNEIVESYLINEEVLKYETIENGEKYTVFNNYNLPYMEVERKFNKNNYLIEETERYINSSSFYKLIYSYNENGWLESKKKFNGYEENPVEEWKYKYDKFGNITNIYFYSFGDLKEEKEIYYNEKSLILSNMLVIDSKSKRVKILQFKEKSFYK